MKRFGTFAVVAVIVFGLAVLINACGGGGGGGGSSTPAITSISTGTQGAQSSAAGMNAAQNASNVGAQLSSLAATGSGDIQVPQLKAFGASNSKMTAINKFVEKTKPLIKKARAMKAPAQGYPITYSCSTGGVVAAGTSNSYTIEINDAYNTFSLTYTNCFDTTTSELTNGAMSFTGSAPSQNSVSAVFTIGSTGAPFTSTQYPYPSSSPTGTPDSKSEAAVSMSFSFTQAQTQDISVTLSANGTFEHWDYNLPFHAKDTLTNFSVNIQETSTTIGGNPYTVDTLTVNGSETGTIYTGLNTTTVLYSQTSTFYNFAIADKYPTGLSGNEYWSINGIFTFDTTPDSQCIEGTYSFVTNTDVAVDNFGVTQSGQITINSAVVVTFLTNGAIQVSVNGGAATTYDQNALDALCAL